MSIQRMIVDIEEPVELVGAGANVGGFPCGFVYVFLITIVPPGSKQ